MTGRLTKPTPRTVTIRVCLWREIECRPLHFSCTWMQLPIAFDWDQKTTTNYNNNNNKKWAAYKRKIKRETCKFYVICDSDETYMPQVFGFGTSEPWIARYHTQLYVGETGICDSKKKMNCVLFCCLSHIFFYPLQCHLAKDLTDVWCSFSLYSTCFMLCFFFFRSLL